MARNCLRTPRRSITAACNWTGPLLLGQDDELGPHRWHMCPAVDREHACFVGLEADGRHLAALEQEGFVVARDRRRMAHAVDADEDERHVVALVHDDLA